MLKNISNFGEILSKTEQKTINGGFREPLPCSSSQTYYNGECWTCDGTCN